MPIVGMTRRQDITPKFPDLGKLRKGGPKTDAKRPGPDLDHWRFTSERRDVQMAFDAAYGSKPALIEAYLPFATLEQNWQTWFEEYDHGGMVHRCDGQTMYRWRTANGDYANGERPCPYYAGNKTRTKDNPGCKQVGRLSMIVPQLIRAGFVGFVTMETHSINDLVSITACLLDAETKAGHLNGILFNVLRVKQSISTPAWKDEDKAAGKRNRTVKDLVKIVPAAEWVLARMQVEAEEQMALAAGQPLQLTARHVDDADDDGDYDDDDDLAEEEPPPVAAPKSPPAPEPTRYVNNDGSVRIIDQPVEPPPSDADTERTALAIRARIVGTTRPDETKAHSDIITKLQGGLHIAVPNDDERHALEVFMLGSDDSSTWTQGQVMAMRTWLNIGKAGDGYAPSAKFLEDWKIIRAAIMPRAEAEIVGK